MLHRHACQSLHMKMQPTESFLSKGGESVAWTCLLASSTNSKLYRREFLLGKGDSQCLMHTLSLLCLKQQYNGEYTDQHS